ncbi:hypothetical protein TU94_26575 [Streptomyces cyaneogriseus subsp. noncyanogenus]|uniref:DUF3040 domain-containing protein n=1 Tax=Streptomyces cyaneogriseus subsp. noncyanogenus TaxID=477245 RepID=A0A0C5GJ96_9ACTN|nr:DUF3040 domain-containing protein [Streptomyces cyaneogriseus]AJP04491.1 hypothetical protein TU94_26575 [Streptomyces cyaneogriseus subsp. noncyanogenus]
MTGPRLTAHERRVLAELERDLRRDRRLDRRMRTFRPGPRSPLARVAAYRPRGRTVAALFAVSVTLMVSGIVTSQPVVIWAFAVAWPVTLYAAFRLLCRWTEG